MGELQKICKSVEKFEDRADNEEILMSMFHNNTKLDFFMSGVIATFLVYIYFVFSFSFFSWASRWALLLSIGRFWFTEILAEYIGIIISVAIFLNRFFLARLFFFSWTLTQKIREVKATSA